MEKIKELIKNKKKWVIAIAGILVLSIILIIAFMTTAKKEKESDKLVLENETTDTETIEEPTTEEPTTLNEDRELPTEPVVHEETTTKETEPYVPATPIEEITQPTEPITEPITEQQTQPQTQPPTEPITEPTTQPVVQPVVNASCELPDVTNMVFAKHDPWNNANDLIDGVYEACVSVAQRWTRGEITGEQARQICLSDPVIMQNDDSGRALHNFCFITYQKQGKGCTYEEYLQLNFEKCNEELTGNEFLYVHSYYNGDTDTTTIYLAKGSSCGY